MQIATRTTNRVVARGRGLTIEVSLAPADRVAGGPDAVASIWPDGAGDWGWDRPDVAAHVAQLIRSWASDAEILAYVDQVARDFPAWLADVMAEEAETGA